MTSPTSPPSTSWSCWSNRDGAQYTVDKTLSELAGELDPREFFRVNRQYLVHFRAVKRFRSYMKGRLVVSLEPPTSDDVVVSADNARRFREWMDR